MKPLFFASISAALLTSCFPAKQVDDEDFILQQTGELHTVTGTTRAAQSAQVSLPISIYALSGNRMADSAQVQAIGDTWRLNLGDGDWTLAARTAWPYYYGKKDIGIDGDAETSIIVSPAIAQVDFSLTGMSTSKVTVELDNLYSRLSPSGQYSGTTSRDIALQWSDTAWTAQEYVMPSRSDLAIFITYNDSTFLYQHDEPLLAGYRYHFRGHYEAGNELKGWIVVGDWLGDKEVEFTWGTAHSGNQNISGDDGTSTTGTLILSAATFSGIHSALNEEGYATEAANKAASYSETGHPAGTWRIPTKDEARAIRSAHPDPSATVRYLCEGGTYSFTMNPSSSITKAGTKATYSLILVTNP